MTDSGYAFHFNEQGMSGYEGPNIPAAEHFSGTDIEQALAREFIQNSLDARSSSTQPVEVDFDLQLMDTSAVPDIDHLRSVMDLVVSQTKDREGHKDIVEAGASAAKSSIPVLCIGDTGTKGLTGTESIHDPFSPLSTLTHSVGSSANTSERGGSFGIGSSVGPLASRMRTVIYVSKPYDKSETVLAATTRLAGYRDDAGTWRRGTGHLTSIARSDDFEYPRGVAKIGDFTPRASNGTDVYVLDYRGASDDDDLLHIRRSAAENFWAAIHEGNLVVRGSTSAASWVINKETLEDVLRSDEVLAESTLPFFLARTQGEHRSAKLAHVGDVDIYVLAEGIPESMRRTQLMRRPLMKIDQIPHYVVSIPYAAVFICRDEEGNKLLRSIEPPAHDRWNTDGPRSNPAAVGEIKAFIRETLREIVPKALGESAKIRGLARFLPARLPDQTPRSGNSRHEAGHGSESGVEGKAAIGVAEVVEPRAWAIGQKVALPTPALTDPDGEPGSAGQRNGGTSPTAGGAKKKDSKVTAGDGRSRIRAGDVSFRAFAPEGLGTTTIVLESPTAIVGDLELMAVGGGDRDDFDPEIISAVVGANDDERTLTWDGATLQGVSLLANTPATIRVTFKNANRYRLGIRNG